MKSEVRIENWRFVQVEGKHKLYGDVYGHPRIGDGKGVFTSSVLEIDEGLQRVETRNTIYLLGTRGPRRDGASKWGVYRDTEHPSTVSRRSSSNLGEAPATARATDKSGPRT